MCSQLISSVDIVMSKRPRRATTDTRHRATFTPNNAEECPLKQRLLILNCTAKEETG